MDSINYVEFQTITLQTYYSRMYENFINFILSIINFIIVKILI